VLPSVAGNHVACIEGVTNVIGVVVDAAEVISVHEESSLRAGIREEVRNLSVVDPWTIIESQCNLVGVHARAVDLCGGALVNPAILRAGETADEET